MSFTDDRLLLDRTVALEVLNDLYTTLDKNPDPRLNSLRSGIWNLVDMLERDLE